MIEIKAHDDFIDEEKTYDVERQQFSDRYYRAKAFLIDKSKQRQPPSVADGSTRANGFSVHGYDRVRLPKINLQIFDGDIDDWLSFRDLFTSLIHSNTDLPEVEKLHYLKGCLQGEPKSLIDPLKITKTNYQIAWDMLMQRYNNSKQLRKRQIQSIFMLPTLANETVSGLHALLDGFERIVKNLDQVVEPKDYRDLLLIQILTARLDSVTRRGWEEFASTKEEEILADLTNFLRRRVQMLESLPCKLVELKGSNQHQQFSKRTENTKMSYSTVQTPGGRCFTCDESHLLYQCPVFQRLGVSERINLLRTHSLCRNCFRVGHRARHCRSKNSCRNCMGRHHTLVCFKAGEYNSAKDVEVVEDDDNQRANESHSPTVSTQTANVSANMVSASNDHLSEVLLATAIVIVEDDNGNRFPARALLDSGSESNFVSERFARRLNVTRERVSISVKGIGETVRKIEHRIRALVRSRITSFSREMDFLILPKVTVNLPTSTVNTEKWLIPHGIKLADPTFFQSREVDLVLGIEAFFEFFKTGRRITLGKGLPALNDSVFGWVACGGVSFLGHLTQTNIVTQIRECTDTTLMRGWKQFRDHSIANDSTKKI